MRMGTKKNRYNSVKMDFDNVHKFIEYAWFIFYSTNVLHDIHCNDEKSFKNCKIFLYN